MITWKTLERFKRAANHLYADLGGDSVNKSELSNESLDEELEAFIREQFLTLTENSGDKLLGPFEKVLEEEDKDELDSVGGSSSIHFSKEILRKSL